MNCLNNILFSKRWKKFKVCTLKHNIHWVQQYFQVIEMFLNTEKLCSLFLRVFSWWIEFACYKSVSIEIIFKQTKQTFYSNIGVRIISENKTFFPISTILYFRICNNALYILINKDFCMASIVLNPVCSIKIRER